MKKIILFVLKLSECFFFVGCAQADVLLNQIDEAISQVQQTRKAVLMDSCNWCVHMEKLQQNVSEDVSHIIRDDLSDLTKGAIQHFGIEARCEIDFGCSVVQCLV